MQNTDKMPVGLTSFNRATDLFQQQYFLAGGDTNFGGQDIIIPLQSLQDAVTAYMRVAGVGPNDVALQMVHCYDAAANELYLRIQLCSLLSTKTVGSYSLNTTYNVWYSVDASGMNPTNDYTTIDQVYFNNFWYCPTATQCDPTQLIPLASAPDKFVNNQVIPWGLEVLLMINDNPNGVSIAFTASSFTGNPTAGVDFPHCITVSLFDAGGNRLIDDNVYPNTFTMKGCDFNTLCPSCCNCYNAPA